MVTKAVVNIGGALQPSGGFPAIHLGGRSDGTNYVFRTEENFWDVGTPEMTLISNQQIVNVYDGAGLTVGEEFFGAHWHRWPNLFQASMSTSDDGTLLNDAGILFKTARGHDYNPNTTYASNRWMHVEPTKGNFVWNNLDKFVDDHYAAGRDITLVMGFGADWVSSAPASGNAAYGGKTSNPPDSLTDWTDYVSAVATRYVGKIKFYECWNEANAGVRWFNGTHAQYVALLKAMSTTIKAIDPTAKIIAPVATGGSTGVASSAYTWSDTMLGTSDGSGGFGRDYVDIFGVHLYVSTPYVQILTAIDAINTLKAAHGLSAKETWDTESGLITPLLKDTPRETIHAQFIRNMLVFASKGIKRTMWYDMDGDQMGWLYKQPTAPAVALWNEVRTWLLNGEITRVNFLWDGRVAVIRGGTNYLI